MAGTSANRKKSYEDYARNNTRDMNKIRDIRRYLKQHPRNAVAETRLQELVEKYGQSNNM